MQSIGLYSVRWQRRRLNLPRPEFRAWNIAVVFTIALYFFLCIAPWFPPPGGSKKGDVSFWYATYAAIAVGRYVIFLSTRNTANDT
jgi:uncharacterized RDD family membrane protein YckC